MSAGGGTRTHTLFRAPAPKAGMSASFITPAAWRSYPAMKSENLSAVLNMLTLCGQPSSSKRCNAWSGRAKRLCDRASNRYPRTTVRDMRATPAVAGRHIAGSSECGVEHVFTDIAPTPYCYLLGMYLGDGCISRAGRVWHLRITLDKKYPSIIARCRLAIDMLMPGQRAGIVKQSRLRRRVSLLQALDMPIPSARPRHEAHAAYRPRTMAAGSCRPRDGRVRHAA